MGGALAVAAGMLDVDQLYIDYKEYMPEFRKPKPESTYIHLVENPMRLSVDLFGGIDLEQAARFFNIGKYDISQELFEQLKQRMGNPRVAEICASLSQFYAFWNSFDFQKALDMSSSLFDQVLRFSDQLSRQFRLDLTQLKKQVDTIRELAKSSRIPLLYNFYFRAEQYKRIGQNDIAALLYYRTIEGIFDNAIQDISEEFDRAKPDYSLFKIDIDKLEQDFLEFQRTIFKDNFEAKSLPSKLAMFDSLCLLNAIGSPFAKGINASRVVNVAQIRNQSVYAHGISPMTSKAIGDMHKLAEETLKLYIDIKQIESIESVKIQYEFMELIVQQT